MRYPFSEWQADFRRATELCQRWSQHFANARQLERAGVTDEALCEVELAREIHAEWEALCLELI